MSADVGPQYTLPTDQRWMAEALCLEVDHDLFFPSSTNPSAVAAQYRVAKAVCVACPVVADCLDYAMTAIPHPEGMWGATTTSERARMRRGAAA